MPALLKELESGKVFELGDFCVIGRNDDVAIRLAHPGISRQHASIRREGRNYWLVDLGSANGTFVNDVALTSARALRHGDRIQLGALVLTFQQSEADTRPDFSANAKTQISRLAPAPMRNEPVTLFVADLKGFTQMSAALSAGQVADLLSEWYADCNAILKGHGASIDKFIGDCVFAYWHGTEPGDSREGAAVGRGVARRRNRTDVADPHCAEGAARHNARLSHRHAYRHGRHRRHGPGRQHGAR